jgi:hypothetical protein
MALSRIEKISLGKSFVGRRLASGIYREELS